MLAITSCARGRRLKFIAPCSIGDQVKISGSLGGVPKVGFVIVAGVVAGDWGDLPAGRSENGRGL